MKSSHVDTERKFAWLINAPLHIIDSETNIKLVTLTE